MTDRAQTKKPFAPIAMDLDEIDYAVEELARRKNIPTLTPPEQRSEQAAPVSTSKPGSRTREDEQGSEGESGGSSPEASRLPPQTEYSPLGFDAPRYLLDELHAAARRQRSSVKYLVLCALKAQGFEVRDEDLIPDGRRLRGSRLS